MLIGSWAVSFFFFFFNCPLAVAAMTVCGYSAEWLGGLNACVRSRSAVAQSVTPWRVVHQAPLSMGFPRQECWSGLPFPSARNLPDSDWTQVFCVCCIAGGFYTTVLPGKPWNRMKIEGFFPPMMDWWGFGWSLNSFCGRYRIIKLSFITVFIP